MARASILRTGHQTLLLQLHRIHYYASFTRYSSARYNCSIVSRIAKLPRVKRTYTPIKDRKGGRESQEPLKPVDHAIVLRTFRIKRLYGLNGTRWRNQSSVGIARRAAIVIVNALIASLPKNSPPLFALDVLPEGTNVLFGREQFEEISGMMNKKKKKKRKIQEFSVQWWNRLKSQGEVGKTTGRTTTRYQRTFFDRRWGDVHRRLQNFYFWDFNYILALKTHVSFLRMLYRSRGNCI